MMLSSSNFVCMSFRRTKTFIQRKKTTLKKVVFKVCLKANRDYLQPHFADAPIPSNLQFLSQAAQTHAESKLP